jgi:hypothetical protein
VPGAWAHGNGPSDCIKCGEFLEQLRTSFSGKTLSLAARCNCCVTSRYGSSVHEA